MAETRNLDERVVVIGMGVMSPTPNGETVDGFWDDVTHNRHGFRPIPEIIGRYTNDVESRAGAPLPPFKLDEILGRHGFNIGSEKELKRNIKMSHKTAQGVVYAGAQALRQATLLSTESLGINEHVLKPEHFGVYQGTGIGGALTAVEVQRMLDARADGEEQGHAEYAYSLLELLPGRDDELAAKIFKARGYNETYGTECAASLSAINEATEHIRNGKVLVALAGGVEMASHPTTIWSFEQLKAVDTTNDPMTIPRPFDESRQGLGFGEGVAEVVLARLDYVQRLREMGHKVTILAEVLGTGSSSDAHHDSFPSDEGPGRALDEAIADGGYRPSELYDTLVEAHAPGTPGDVKEINAITSRLKKPSKVVGIVSIKSLLGHTFGSTGAFGFISATKSLTTNVVHPNRNLNNPIPETEGYPMVPNEAIKVKNVRFALINSFGFGGKNRVTLLGKYFKRAPRASKLRRAEIDI